MREELISIIKILGVNYSEVVVDIELESFSINSIEVYNNNIIIHIFVDNMDIEMIYDNLPEEDRKIIYQTLRSYLYN